MHVELPYGPQDGSECGQGSRGGNKWAGQTPGRTKQLRACEATNQKNVVVFKRGQQTFDTVQPHCTSTYN